MCNFLSMYLVLSQKATLYDLKNEAHEKSHYNTLAKKSVWYMVFLKTLKNCTKLCNNSAKAINALLAFHIYI